jgi:hypothetical protein
MSLGLLQDSIDLDLGSFKTIQVNRNALTMTIGGTVEADGIASAPQAAGGEIRKHYS